MRLLRLLYPRYVHGAVALIGALLGVSAVAHGDPRQGYVISIENDFFGAGSNNTDRWYTNGFQFAQSFRRDRLPEILNTARDFGSAI